MTDTDHSPITPPPASAAPASALASAHAGAGQKRGGGSLVALVLLLLLAVILGGALYYQNHQYRILRADLEQQHQQNTQLIQETRTQAGQALSLVQEQASRIQQLGDALDATAAQVQELDQALRLTTDSGSELLLINDIDHLVTIAQQQLSLGGNVANAIISLEAAQSINGDLDRLRAVATIDLPNLSARIDHLSDLVGQAPLLVPDTVAQPAATPASTPAESAPSSPAAPAPAEGWRAMADGAWQWTRDAAGMISRDLRDLFEVRRVDDAAALLMSPDQALRFREVLKQRTVTAELALMMRQSRIWQAELDQLARAIEQRYDMRTESAREALKLARDLHDTPIELTLPTVDNSLAAIAAARDAAEASDLDDSQPDENAEPEDSPAAVQPVANPAEPGVI